MNKPPLARKLDRTIPFKVPATKVNDAINRNRDLALGLSRAQPKKAINSDSKVSSDTNDNPKDSAYGGMYEDQFSSKSIQPA